MLCDTMVVEVREDHALQHSAQRDPVVEHLRRDHRLAVGDAHAEHLADDDLMPRRKWRPIGDLVEASTHWPRCQQMVDQWCDIGTECRMRGEQGVHTSP